jgi:hypothetical protein
MRERTSLAAMIVVAVWLAVGVTGTSSAAGGGTIDSGLYYGNAHGQAWDAGAIHQVDWYQGQEGKWHRGPQGKWDWRGNPGNEWYWGQRGHWYKENNGWQFGSDGMVCNANGRDCRRGRYLPANGEGMVNKKNSNLYWKCNSDGHNCDWARRPR